MIAVDTSSLVHYLAGSDGQDVEAVELALAERQVCFPPVVLSELLSDPMLTPGMAELFAEIPLLELRPGFWERAGLLRARVLSAGRRARLADALIAQSCLDHDVTLITRDRDFKHFAGYGLRAVPEPR